MQGFLREGPSCMEAVNSLLGCFGSNCHSAADKFIQSVCLLKWSPLQSMSGTYITHIKICCNFLFSPIWYAFSGYYSVAQSCPTLWLHGLQRPRLPCPSPFPGVSSDSCPLGQCCHPTISSSAARFSFCLQSFPASGPFPMTCLFPSSGQSIGASASVLPMDIDGEFPLGMTGLISLQSRGLKSLLQDHNLKAPVLWGSAFFMYSFTSIHDYWKNHSFDYMDLCRQNDVSAFQYTV